MKVIDYIKNSFRPALYFNHGLGDFVNFLPVFFELEKQTGKNIALISDKKRQFKLIYSKLIYSEDIPDLINRYDYIYSVKYPDSKSYNCPIEHHDEPCKAYLCGLYEFGMKLFNWKPFILKNENYSKTSKRIGVHLFGHTGMADKLCTVNVIKQIWNEIINSGHDPHEIHMIPEFIKEYNVEDRGCHTLFSFINKKNSLRFEKPDLQKMINEIAKCKFFIGIDSGPIYLAGTIIGFENIIGLINERRHDQFVPIHISTVDVKNYKKGNIMKLINQKGNTSKYDRNLSHAVYPGIT